MTLVALAMETGCYDEKFGSRLAEKLGLRLVDMRSFERHVAEHSDHNDGVVRRLIAHGNLGTKCCKPTCRQFATSICEETLATAAEGNVLIVGWSAAAILRTVEHAVRIRIFAALPWRERNVLTKLAGQDARIARLDIESSDALISRFVQRMADADWLDPSLYHLTLNAEDTAGEACAEIVEVTSRQFRATATSREELAGMLTRLRQTNQFPAAGRLGRHAVADVDGHKVALTGDETHEDAIAKIERYLHGGRKS